MIRTPSDPGIPYVHEIRSVSPSDTGMYTCVARNVVGRSVTSNVRRNLYFDNHVTLMTYMVVEFSSSWSMIILDQIREWLAPNGLCH